MTHRIAIALLYCAAPIAVISSVTVAAHAQAAPNDFVTYEDSPFGPGDRSMDLKVQLNGTETNSNVELWVVYGDNLNEVTSATLSGRQPRGQVRLGTVNGEAVASGRFIFPHNSKPQPNMNDANAVTIRNRATVYYKLVKKRGATVTTSPVVTFEMPDSLTIANLGDSFASGEGAPNEHGTDWADELCHRSNNAGQVLAVRTIIDENPGIAFTLRNVACSGAQIGEGIMYSQHKATWFGESDDLQTRVIPQLADVSDWLARNNFAMLNIAMVSGGGNDVNFGHYIAKYFVAPGFDTEFKVGTPAYNNLRQDISTDIPGLYRNLRTTFDENFEYDYVLVAEYPDLTRDSSGRYCDDEHAAMDTGFLAPLNNTIKTTIASFPKFRYVDGTGAKSRTHGLCSTVKYVNDMGASLYEQVDPYGFAHPNREGHERIYKPVYEEELRIAVRAIRAKADAIKIRTRRSEALADAKAKARAAAEEKARENARAAAIEANRQALLARRVGDPLKGLVALKAKTSKVVISPAQQAAIDQAVADAKANRGVVLKKPVVPGQ